ncbi:HDOD domain-containing protein [Desulfogranum mediterraneum]|uniref:HDOD domain-containing protein n=1 Tax=Desulfogranum mediterraneum TaxID=160661 RepID=UPI0004031394|nr:HDOD domain-containing protein [Desulfogranum mediterraneum]
MDALLKDVMKTANLFTLPDVYLRLKSILDDPDYAMAEVSVVISHDPAMTFRLLRIVNSSLYGFAQKVETVSRAITLLGSHQVHDIVLAASVAEAFKGIAADVMDVRKFWRCSVQCAVTCSHLALLCGACDKEKLFVAGLLHDIGHLVMYQAVPSLSQQALFYVKNTGKSIVEAEQKMLGFDYTQIGAYLMEQWELSGTLKETTAHHVLPEKAEHHPLETVLVHIGSLLTRANDGEGVFNEGVLAVHPYAWEISRLSPEDCTSIQEEVKKDVRVAMELIFL